jgi:hypothetical protein
MPAATRNSVLRITRNLFSIDQRMIRSNIGVS